MIYQGVYWALVVLEADDIDLASFFDVETIDNLCWLIKDKENIALFNGTDRGLSKVTNKRFKLLADFF
jgi:hypothetical protein